MDTFGIRSGSYAAQLDSLAARSTNKVIGLDIEGIRPDVEGTPIGGYTPRSGIENIQLDTEGIRSGSKGTQLERWLSGLRRRFAKALGSYPTSRVRIPFFPISGFPKPNKRPCTLNWKS